MKDLKEKETSTSNKSQPDKKEEDLQKVLDELKKESEDLKIMKEKKVRLIRPPKTA